MISAQILQNTLDGLKDITDVSMSVVDMDGNTCATTFATKDNRDKDLKMFLLTESNRASDKGNSKENIKENDMKVIGDRTYFKIYDEHGAELVLIADGNDKETEKIGRMAAFQIQNMLVAYRERYDRDNFVRSLLLDNLLLVDIYNRAKKLHIDTSVRRCVFLAEVKADKEVNVPEVLKTLFPGKSRDFLTAVDEKDAIVVKEVEEGQGIDAMEKIAKSMADSLHEAGVSELRIAYGTIVNDIKEVSKTYKEAKMALDVGKIFFEDREVVGYSKLGIGRLIYQLPLPLCKMFIREIFDGRNPDEFDEETVITINKFFENSLNVSETSRQLYIHRNTLVYRIDKLQKATGLDLRIFDDAITFKIALMVGKYMKYMEKQNY